MSQPRLTHGVAVVSHGPSVLLCEVGTVLTARPVLMPKGWNYREATGGQASAKRLGAGARHSTHGDTAGDRSNNETRPRDRGNHGKRPRSRARPRGGPFEARSVFSFAESSRRPGEAGRSFIPPVLQIKKKTEAGRGTATRQRVERPSPDSNPGPALTQR